MHSARKQEYIMLNTKIIAHTPFPVPRESKDWVRKFETSRSLNDAVEAHHTKLMNGRLAEKYFKFLDALHDSQAQEGSLAADNFSAVTMIREQARNEGDRLVGEQNLATLNRSLGVVLKRYGLSRKERANTVGGKVVRNGDDD